MGYYNLHSHTDMSNTRLLDSINKVSTLIDYAHNIGLLGIAITDHEDLGNHIKAEQHLDKRKKENPDDETWQNFKLILGNEIYLCRNGMSETNFIKGEDAFYHFILLALDEVGHEQLRELSTKAFQNSWYRNMRRVPTYYEDVEKIIGQNPGHVWASTACLGGYLPTCILKENYKEADRFIEWCKKTFQGNFSLELQPSDQKEQIKVNNEMIKLAAAHDVLHIVTTDAHYLKLKDRKIHKAFLNSKGGDRETDDFYSSTYVMNREEIHKYIDSTLTHENPEFLVDVALNNTIKIGDLVKDYTLIKTTHLPYMPLNIRERNSRHNEIAKQSEQLQLFLESDELADQQLAIIICDFIHDAPSADISQIDIELKSISETSDKMDMKWSKYLLQMADYINILWTEGDTLVGPARGSGAGFYINYILGITQIDPTREKAKMYHWRFLNPERASLLDIDTDIQSNRRNKCIRALKNNYGEKRAIEVATFGTEKAKNAIKTACRGLGVDVDTAAYLTSFIQSERGIQHTLAQTFHGDEENNIRPNMTFRNLMITKYPTVWEVAQEIEGLISRVGKHAGGVVITDEDFTKRAAIRTTNKDEFVSQYELHDLEALGLIKIDLLAIESLDRIRACLDLLVQYEYLPKGKSLRETYEDTIGVYQIERTNPQMWEMVWNNEIISLFQMEQGSGIQAISLTKPQSLEDLATINSVMRLMATERGAEQPLNKYARFKQYNWQWEQEMKDHGLNQEERALMHSYLDYEHGICATQEDLMSMVQDPLIGGFSLAWSDKLRKAIAKKQPKDFDLLTTEFFENAREKELSLPLTKYVWNILFTTQKGYSFNLAHTLSYSLIGLQEMNLAFRFPIIFWNAANIIVDSMGTDFILDDENEIGYVAEEDEDEDEDEKASAVEYGKIAKAIGKMMSYGVLIHPPDINKSKLTFSPDVGENTIYYGLKGISKINDKIAENIIMCRPYNNVDDVIQRVKLTKPQVVSLIKSGAFDSFGDRVKIMRSYISSISDTKKKLTLQNTQMLIKQNLFPEELAFEVKVFNFNKYIKKTKMGDNLGLDQVAFAFYEKNFDVDLIDFSSNSEKLIGVINAKQWDKIYQSYMNTVRDYIKANEVDLLAQLNGFLIKDNWEKYAKGTLSKWEMDSISYYYHEHELENVSAAAYEFTDFNDLPEESETEYSFTTKEGHAIEIKKLSKIAGTVLDKDKTKHTVTLLTTTGVVTVKIWSAQFSKYDKQISQVQADGKKKIIEKSWFSRGNKLIIVGIKKGANFIPKVYKNSEWRHPITLITDISHGGILTLKTDRSDN